MNEIVICISMLILLLLLYY